MKSFLASGPVQAALPWVAAGYLHTARACLRMLRDDSPKGQAILDRGRPVMACFWHGRLLPVALSWRGVGVDMLISKSRDGRLIAKTARHFGHDVIEGSTARGQRDRGGVQAARQIVSQLSEGRVVGITPDGPRGPRMRASEGAVRLAQMAGVDLVPVTAALSPAFRAKSWDRMVVPVPVPFARGAFLIGDPIIVSPKADAAERQRIRLALETDLNRLTAEADALVGAPAIAPAAAAAAP
mgnify:CR=1 FL=1